MLVRIVSPKLLDPTEVGFTGALTQTFEVDKSGILLIPCL